MTNVCTDRAGIYRGHFRPGDEVRRGDVLADIVSPDDGECLAQVLSPTGGIVFFAHTDPLVREGTMIYKLIRRLHQ